MHVTLVEINVHEDKIDEFIEVFRQNHLGSVQEEGNLRFDVLQDPELNSRFYIYEAYKDEDAVAFHKTTPHYKTCVAKLESLMTGPRKKRLFNGLMTGVKKCLTGTPLYICTLPLNDRVRRWSCLPECRWRISNTLPILAVAQVTAPPCCINVGLRPG